MTDGAEERTRRASRRPEPEDLSDEPTQADDSTRLGAREADRTRVAGRGPAHDAQERIDAPPFAARAVAEDTTPGPGTGRDVYRPRTDAPRGPAAAPRPAVAPMPPGTDGDAGIVTPEQRADRARHDQWARARRAAALTGATVLALGAAVALAVALL